MTSIITNNLPDSVNQLSPYRRERVNEILQILNTHQQVIGTLLGGSLTYKTDLEKSDVDLFCLIHDVHLFEKSLHGSLNSLRDVAAIIYQGSFPWTERLHTIYFNQDMDFSIDLCLINDENADTFFWEPDGYILIDKTGLIDRYRQGQMRSPHFTRQPFLKSNPFSLAIITLKKIDKNLSRGHFWNALEQLSILRRYVMQIIRLNVIKHNYFLGRVDRDIEDVIPHEINLKLSTSIPKYDGKDIANKALQLIGILESLRGEIQKGDENKFSQWILTQLEHERIKLKKYSHAQA